MLSVEERNRRIENGICVRCKKPHNRGTWLCDECWKKQKDAKREDYARCIRLGICPRCRENFLEGDEKSCPECKAKRNNHLAKTRDKESYNAYMRSYQKERTQKLRENGICTVCGKRKPTSGYVTCAYCRNKNKRDNSYVENRRTIRMKQGKCYFCDNEVVKGLKVCEVHRQRLTEMSRSEKAVEGRRKRKW